jgi:NAD/NADP transhydrogenase alpha subunit
MYLGIVVVDLARSPTGNVASTDPLRVLLIGLTLIGLEALRLVVWPAAGALGRGLERLVAKLWRD